MAKTDPELGKRVYTHLTELGLETKVNHYHPRIGKAHTALYDGVQGFLSGMGLDICDPSIRDTPRRVAEMFTEELCAGLNYDNFPKCTVTPNNQGSSGKYDQVVRVRGLQTISLCEHHLQTIYGVTHVAYIPGPKLLGLSKFSRVANFFARRPQVQERMTEQLHAALVFILQTEDVAVIQDCQHFCMIARGAIEHGARTQTDKMSGRFLTNAPLRQEFLHGLS